MLVQPLKNDIRSIRANNYTKKLSLINGALSRSVARNQNKKLKNFQNSLQSSN